MTNSIYNLWSESFKTSEPVVESEDTDKAAELAQDILADVVKEPVSADVTADQAEALNQSLKSKANYSAEWSDADKAIEVFYNPPKKDRQLLATIAADQTVTYTDALNTKRVMKKELPDMIGYQDKQLTHSKIRINRLPYLRFIVKYLKKRMFIRALPKYK